MADGGRAGGHGFPWQDTGEQLAAFVQAFPAARADAGGRTFAPARAVAVGVKGQMADGPSLRLPQVLPAAQAGEAASAYLARMPDQIGRQGVLLLQAGATAVGYWDEDELLRHRARKRYVVRGSGKAQAKHLREKGKSRYGSRLRLQNWQRLLVETNLTLREWWDELGAPEQVFWSVPIKAWVALAEAQPTPPFGKDTTGAQRVPFHVHVPNFAELERVRRRLARGRLWLPGEDH